MYEELLDKQHALILFDSIVTINILNYFCRKGAMLSVKEFINESAT